MERIALLLGALLLAGPAGAFGGRKSQDDGAPAGSALIEELRRSVVDKKRFEAYVKRRLGKIDAQHQARMDFMAAESRTWSDFWGKVRDQRRLFEIRLSRQTLDFFDSLSSINSADRDAAIDDFERLQSNVINAFEAQQRQKLDDFFAARDKRWQAFVAQQETERAKFMAEAPADWQRTGLAVGATADQPPRPAADEAKDAPADGSSR
jgi:hypothetical protein